MTSLQPAALAFHDTENCVIPAAGGRRRATDSKQPWPDGPKWERYQTERPSREQVTRWFGPGSDYEGFGVVNGAVSGGLETTEFEGRAVHEGLLDLAKELCIAAGLGHVWERITTGYLEMSPSEGMHILYRLTGMPVPGNTQLARRPATEAELASNPKERVKVLIETRGEGGFVVVAPSGGTVHPTGKPWRQIHGGPGSIPALTAEERNALHAVLRSLDQMPKPEPARFQQPAANTRPGEVRPGDDFSERANWVTILTGWTHVYERGGIHYWRRPGKDRGISATTRDAGGLYVFSTSTEFDAEKPYTKFGAYTVLNHGGDHTAAAAELYRLGYGTRHERNEKAGAQPGPNGEEDKPKQTQAALLVKLARERYELITGDDGRPYAVARNGPAIARPLRGRGGLREQLAKIYSDACRGAVASASAFTDAIAVLEGHASQADPVPVHLRVAPHGGGIVLDLGTPDGRCVIAGPSGWRSESRSPVLFRRTALTMALPDPLRGGTLSPLQELLNASEETFRLMAAWLLAALIPWIPHPVLALLGEQGTAKSSAARLLIGLIDPSPAPLRSPPRDLRQWAVTASAGWTVCIDNISSIPGWLSDCLCKAVTGDGIVDRALYTDDDVVVLAFRRVIALTSIDAGELRGDLGDRLLPAELDRINDAARRTDEQIAADYTAALPQLLGAILTLLCDCLAALPSVNLDSMPRMADFARLLAALDQVTGWDTLVTYETTAADIAETVVESDLFAEAVRELVTVDGSDARWEGTASKLLEHITPAKPAKWWPRTPRAASGRLRRSAPSLRRLGVEVAFTRQPGTGARVITVECLDIKCGFASHRHTVTPPAADQRKRCDANDGSHDGRDANDGVTQKFTQNLEPCTRCGAPHQRYGPAGRPCRTTPATVEAQ